MAGSALMKPVTLPPGFDRLSTKPEPTGSTRLPKMIGMMRVCLSNVAVVGALEERIRADWLRTSSLAGRLILSGSECSPAVFQLDVAALRPSELIKPLPERGRKGLSA